MTATEIIENAKKYLSYKYLYGYKGETITKEQNAQLTKLYPRIWGQTIYKTNSTLWANGKNKAIDCSGLVCRAAGIPDLGSYQMEEHWKSTKEEQPGAVLWREGHVALIIKPGLLIEASGIKTGVRVRTYSLGEFVKILLIPNVDYATQQDGWLSDGVGWHYVKNGQYLKDGYYKLKWSGGTNLFYMDANGYCIITDSNGVIKEPRG